jgi:hypothetical protein
MAENRSIHDIYQELQAHPDYLFGAIFTVHDLPDRSLAHLYGKHESDHLAEVGNLLIRDQLLGADGTSATWAASDAPEDPTDHDDAVGPLTDA